MGQLPEKDEDLGPPVVELEGQVIGVPHLNRGIFKHSATNCQQSVRQPPSTSSLPIVSQLSASCQPTVIKLPGKRQQVVRQLSASCLATVSKSNCQQAVSQRLSSCQANVSKLSGNCYQAVRQTSASCLATVSTSNFQQAISQRSASCQLTASNSE